MHKVCFRFHNSPERRFLSFKMHEIASQQSFGHRNRISARKKFEEES